MGGCEEQRRKEKKKRTNLRSRPRSILVAPANLVCDGSVERCSARSSQLRRSLVGARGREETVVALAGLKRDCGRLSRLLGARDAASEDGQATSVTCASRSRNGCSAMRRVERQRAVIHFDHGSANSSTFGFYLWRESVIRSVEIQSRAGLCKNLPQLGVLSGCCGGITLIRYCTVHRKRLLPSPIAGWDASRCFHANIRTCTVSSHAYLLASPRPASASYDFPWQSYHSSPHQSPTRPSPLSSGPRIDV